MSEIKSGKSLNLIFMCMIFFSFAFCFTGAKAIARDRVDANASSLTEGISMTIYNQNKALIKQRRSFDLEKGINHIDWTNTASTMDIHSVNLRSVNAESPIEVKEQIYQWNETTSSAILARYIGKPVYIKHFLEDGKIVEESGILISCFSGPGDCVVKVGDRYVLSLYGQVEVSELPKEFVGKPLLSFAVKALESGRKNLLLTYEANNLKWQCDYNLLLNRKQNKFDLMGWVTLTNQSGIGFKDCNLKLIAGNVHGNRYPGQNAYLGQDAALPVPAYGTFNSAAAVEEQNFADYHLYSFPESIDIDNSEVKKLVLIERKEIPVIKKYVFDQQYYGRIPPKPKAPVQIRLEFLNNEKDKQPLPAGEVTVYQADENSDEQLIGEDQIPHTAIGEKITIKLGECFDILGERIRTNTEQTSTHKRKDTFKVQFSNHLDKEIVLTDIEHVPDFANFSSESPFSKVNSNTYQVEVKVPPNGTADVDYNLVSKL